MNPSYFVQVPGTDFPTAEVEASSSKHARTAYLDYLSRNEYIGWRDRQAWRRKTITKRMQPGEFKTQILLDYDGIPAVTTTELVDVPPETAGPAMDMGEVVEDLKDMKEAEKLEEETGYPAADYLTGMREPPRQSSRLSVLGKVPSVLPKARPFEAPKAMEISKKFVRGA